MTDAPPTPTATRLGPLTHLDAELAGSDAQPDPDQILDSITAWVADQGLTLYPAQEEALLELASGANVILGTPTGSGKSLVAAGAHASALAQGQRTFYTAPIKALVSEKFFALIDLFGPDDVGLLTGDASVNADAPLVCCTAEILANLALRDGPDADVDQVVMDEFHFYAEPDRGWAWQVPLLELPHAQFLLMSATLGDTSFFQQDLERRTGRDTAVITHAERPIPLEHRYVTTPVHETVASLVDEGQAPIYIVHFEQAAALERAQALTSMRVATRDERDAIAEELAGFRFARGFGTQLSRLLRHGVGVHHAGMLPKYRRLVERLSQRGLLKVICGTDTLGVGINVPIRTVLFTGLTKFDGARTRVLRVREFHQIGGRAGRPGYDASGLVVVQAPEHVIENAKALAKAGDDPKRRKKVKRKSPPEGSVSWSEQTFRKLVDSEPEPLRSRFRVSHALLLSVLDRPGDAYQSLKHLLTDNHEDRPSQRQHIRRAIALYRELRAAGVIEELDEPDEEGRRVRLTVELPEDFALNQPLSAFALWCLEQLDPESETYALDVVSVIEATLEDPRQVLAAQQHAARGAAVAAMKAEGIPYEERMERLEEVTHPKPLDEWLDAAFARYLERQPWAADHEPSPKSVVRDLVERAMTFGELVQHYGLTRSEGLLLRYLADAYRTLRQTVPPEAKTAELVDLEAWLGEMVRQTDSSLLDEWEALRHPQASPEGEEARPATPEDEGPPPVTANDRAFRVLVRNAAFRRVWLASRAQWEELGALHAEDGWDADAWAQALEPFLAEHGAIGAGPSARGPHLLVIDDDPPEREERRVWRVRQILEDPRGDHDWAITAHVDLDASDAQGEAVLHVVRVGPGVDPTVDPSGA